MECVGLIGKVFGHKYEARYDSSDAHETNLSGCSVDEAVQFLEATKSHTYVCDICERCGDIIHKEAKNAA